MPRQKALGGHADVAQFRTALGKGSEFPKALQRNLRKELRAAAQPVVMDMRATVQQAPTHGSKGGDGEGGPTQHSIPLRSTIADGITVSILAGKKAGVVIKSTGKGLPPGSRSLVRAYDKPGGWRHPSFGNDVWVTQYGRPYFSSRVKAHREQVTNAVVRALRDSAATLKG